MKSTEFYAFLKCNCRHHCRDSCRQIFCLCEHVTFIRPCYYRSIPNCVFASRTDRQLERRSSRMFLERSLQFWQQQFLIKFIQIMSVGFPIDVTRLLGDNQRFQRDLSFSHQQRQQLRSQLDQAHATIQTLTLQCDQFQRKKQQQFKHFIATHQQLYQSQIEQLTLEKTQLIKKLQKQSQQSSTAQMLRSQIKKHEQQKSKMEGQLSEFKAIMISQQSQINKKIQGQLQKKYLQIQKLEARNVDLEKINKLAAEQLETVRAENAQIKLQYGNLNKEWSNFQNNTPKGALGQLMELRKENNILKKSISEGQLEAIHNDQDLYNTLKEKHEQLAVLRYDLTEAKNRNLEIDLLIQNEKDHFRNEKVQLQLSIFKLQKELSYLKNEDHNSLEKLNKLEEKLRSQAEQISSKEKLQEEIAILRIKVFVLESLRGSEKYRKKGQAQFYRFQSGIEYLSSFKLKSSQIDVLHNFASMHAAMGETTEKLKEQELKRREATRKAKEYKFKWDSLSKKEMDLQKIIGRFKLKQEQYQKLIEKIQAELERAYLLNTQTSQRHNINLLITPYQQKIQMINNQNTTLQNQVKNYQISLQTEKRNYQKDIQKFNIEITKLEATNNQLYQKNRTLEAKMLQLSLTSASNKSNKNYQAQLVQKTSSLIIAQRQLQSSRNELAMQRQANQNHLLTITQLRQQTTSLTQQLNSPHNSSIQQQINYLQQKIAYLEGVLGEQRTSSNDNHIKTLYEEIALLKASTQVRDNTVDKSDRVYSAEREIQSYRTRLMELQEALHGIAGQNEYKNLEIFRLNEENNLLSKQLDKFQQQLDMLRGKASNMREIELMDRNKQLEGITANIEKELTKIRQTLHIKQQQNASLKKQCDEYYADNLKLLLVIKQNKFQLKQNKFLTEKYEQERSLRQQQLQNKTESLMGQNNILKNLVQDLRKQILNRKSINMQDESNRAQYQSLKIQLQGKERELNYFKQEIERHVSERMKQKQLFDFQWNKLIYQLNSLKQQLEYQHQMANKKAAEKADEDSRIKLVTTQSIDQQNQNQILRRKISQLESEIRQKNDKIYYMQAELKQNRLSMNHNNIYSGQVLELRNQIQSLMTERFTLQDRLRTLEQQNSLLKIRRITQDLIEKQLFTQASFGPSVDTNKFIEQLRQSIKEIPLSSNAQSNSYKDRYEESLCLLVISWAQIQSLRAINMRLQQKSNRQFEEYTSKLRSIELNIRNEGEVYVNLGLLKNLQCSHKHLFEITQHRLKEGSFNALAQLGSFTESINGGKMIESYSVREQDQSMTSQQILT